MTPGYGKGMMDAQESEMSREDESPHSIQSEAPLALEITNRKLGPWPCRCLHPGRCRSWRIHRCWHPVSCRRGGRALGDNV